jgi:hypothetical protein
MKYRAWISFIADDEETARTVFNAAKGLRSRMRTVRKGEPAEERSFIILEKHYHDEDPSKPCEVIEEYWSD